MNYFFWTGLIPDCHQSEMQICIFLLRYNVWLCTWYWIHFGWQVMWTIIVDFWKLVYCIWRSVSSLYVGCLIMPSISIIIQRCSRSFPCALHFHLWRCQSSGKRHVAQGAVELLKQNDYNWFVVLSLVPLLHHFSCRMW